MKRLSFGLAVLFCLSLFVLPASAKTKWRTVGTAIGPNPTELAFGGDVAKIRFKCTAGTIAIHVVHVRQGAQHTEYTVAVQLQAGQEHVLTFPAKIMGVTGFRMGHGGGGTYEVSVEADVPGHGGGSSGSAGGGYNTDPKPKGDWTKKAELTAGGDGKEVPVGQKIARIFIRCENAPMTIQMISVRSGGAVERITVARNFNVKDEQVIPLANPRVVDSLRIGDGGGGIYTVWVAE